MKSSEDFSALEEELNKSKTELGKLKQEKYVLSKGLTGEEAEFIAFKAGKMVDDKTTFEQAVDALTADRKKTSFDWTAPVGGGTAKNRRKRCNERPDPGRTEMKGEHKWLLTLSTEVNFPGLFPSP